MIGPDEPRYAWIGRAMAQSGDWVTPRLWGDPWFEKPALLYWMTAAAFRAGLGEDWAPRFPVACLSVLFLGFFYWRMKTEFGRPAAVYAVTVLATSAGWVAYSDAAIFDLPLSAAFGAAMLLLLGWLERQDRRMLAPFAALMGVTVLAKGLVGPVLALLAIVCWAARMGARPLAGLAQPVPAMVFVAIAVPWYALCYARHGMAFIDEFFWKHHVSRFAAGALEHNQPLWYFVPVLAAGLLPWTPVYAALARAGVWRGHRPFFLICWAATTITFFSLSRDKLPSYVLPALPALAALAGIVLAQEKPLRVLLPLSALMLGLMPAAAAVLPKALDVGLSEALTQARFPALPVAAVCSLALGVWAAERAGRRQVAVAAIAISTVAGYVLIKQSTLPVVDQQAGVRPLWRRAEAHRDSICLGEVRRHLVYGLNYYAGRQLPKCKDEPRPYRIENREIIGPSQF